jgi:hypothetical protein
MNADKEKALVELAQRNPFWVCLAVFLALVCDQGFRLAGQIDQRTQLNQAKLMQAQNIGVLIEAQHLETRLQALSLDLLQIANTNTVAKQIVQDFNIQWNPGPATAPPTAPPPTTPPPPAGSPK